MDNTYVNIILYLHMGSLIELIFFSLTLLTITLYYILYLKDLHWGLCCFWIVQVHNLENGDALRFFEKDLPQEGNVIACYPLLF